MVRRIDKLEFYSKSRAPLENRERVFLPMEEKVG